MTNTKRCLFASILIIVIVTCIVACAAKDEDAKDEVKLKSYKSKLVLYTVCRGGNKKVGHAARDLYFLAEEKIIRLLSSPTYVYLNDREGLPSKHWLTEIRLDARSDAIEHAGKLGEWIDIKEIPAYQAAAAIKDKGVADPGPVYDKLYSWIFEHGYVPAGRPIENLLLGTTNSKYENIKSEITIPVKKLSADTKEGDG
jgi:effector-binding domain-containing protein